MRIVADHLLALAAVARTGSLTAAGNELGKTQPAVSAQLRELADSVGTPLFLRHRYGVTLTREAETLLPYAEACARAVEGANQAVVRLKGLEVGSLHLLASTSTAVYFLPPVLSSFHAGYPGIDIKISRHQAESAIEALKRGQGDLAVVRCAPALLSKLPPNLVAEHLMKDDTVLVVPHGHKLARFKSVDLRKLDGLDIVSREPGSATQGLVDRLVASAGARLNVKFQTVGVEGVKEAILRGFGAGFLSRLSVERDVANGTLVAIPIKSSRAHQVIAVIHPTSGHRAPAGSRFVTALLESVRS
ncbi:LysR family transcriptional regulator [Pigmentiphaga soli]|uniref:LysR family transcriptional regulator n=1 Tax=Pigmentiphaga soli TaxID=1007095 RepID=A0ABP8H023_9BURK